jgi:hypothetical protein
VSPDPDSPVGDDEMVLRHIPAIMSGPDVSSANFELRPNEDYASVCRAAITHATAMLRVLRTTPGSRVATARVGDIRALGLRVEPHRSKRLPGHAGVESGIASGSSSLDDEVVRIRLAALFRFLPRSAYRLPSDG